jgi:hypothetical protein
MNSQIDIYNKTFIENNENINIIDYIKYITTNIYKLNILFSDELLELIIKGEISIHYKYLVNLKINIENLKNNKLSPYF